ncbi:lactam utilization protein [Francisella halioticida]|uniref:Lactam utilization protein LamB n=1 Tax=Francisella halioticida TaxID=549298 RepID=A0ABN5AYB4_9GAMM|nr:5-oxoprolinase subunit PxpA [Francisella halioticida]ASG67117.1 lactam utilization protein LamB [Francisella halioticida]BCD91939.1 lactam utilization protein [Francisella halioticida]
MLLINCDLGERGVAHVVDDQLVKYIDIANIACGGHAGDKQSVDYYVDLCKKNNVKVTAHVSYPDKENFGRKVINMVDGDLCDSFDEQFALFDGNIKSIKPHGALYNELNVDEKLVKTFVSWCVKNDVQELLVSPFGLLKKHAEENDIKTTLESFSERGYFLDKNNKPMLIPRGQPNAEIKDVQKTVEQYRELARGFINVKGQEIAFDSQTICIHSDSEIVLELAKQLNQAKG